MAYQENVNETLNRIDQARQKLSFLGQPRA